MNRPLDPPPDVVSEIGTARLLGEDRIDAQAFEFVKQPLGLGGFSNALATLKRDQQTTFDRLLLQPVATRPKIQCALLPGSQNSMPLVRVYSRPELLVRTLPLAATNDNAP